MNKISELAVILICLLLWMSPVFSHDHLKAQYVPWGIDEYELFGLNKAELAQEFKNKIHFNKTFSEGYLTAENYGPRFLLTYDHDCVSGVQRMFIDACQCHIMGPVLSSKVEALKFSINGLSALGNGRDARDQARLVAAKKILNNIEQSQRTAVHNDSDK